VQQFKDQLFYAENSPAVTGDDETVKFSLFESIIGALTNMLCPYAWIEGEGASRSTFDSLVANPDASEGAYLSLDTEAEPPSLDDGSGRGYTALYHFTVNSLGKYTLWMSGSDLNSPDTSPFTYSIDGRAPVPVHGLPSDSAPYGGMFYWTNLGDVGIERGGSHTLTIVVSDRRRSDDHFALMVDAFCITRVPFKPNGVSHPPIAPVAAPPALPHSKHKPSDDEPEPPMIDSEPDVNLKPDQ
jgi:hypothetical protein